VVRGANRPDRWTNIYISDPAQSPSAWLELQLPRRTRFNQIQVTFDTDVNRRIRLPLFRSPECVKRYDIAVWLAGAWQQIADVSDNYYRRRVHTFSPVDSDRVRINVHETNGTQSARIYEVRLYYE
jgi:hypothetical protein